MTERYHLTTDEMTGYRMSKLEILDNVAHADIKVRNEYSDALGDGINQVRVFPTEFSNLQREYPIFFRKSDAGNYHSFVFLGLEKGENLFLGPEGWRARYVPAAIARGPFSYEIRQGDNGEADQTRIIIDTDHIKVGDVGEALFLPRGGNTPYLDYIIHELRKLHIGAVMETQFFSELEAFDLIEPVALEIKLSERKQVTAPDLFTISASKIAELSGDALTKLNGLGLLEHCFAILASAGNMAYLVDKKSEKDAGLVLE